jgi:hypothetical protein
MGKRCWPKPAGWPLVCELRSARAIYGGRFSPGVVAQQQPLWPCEWWTIWRRFVRHFFIWSRNQKEQLNGRTEKERESGMRGHLIEAIFSDDLNRVEKKLTTRVVEKFPKRFFACP